MAKNFKLPRWLLYYRELFFRIAILLKGLDGILEILGGAAFFSVGPRFIVKVVGFLTQDEIAEDPHDVVANFLRRTAAHLSLSGEHFIGAYLLIDGVIKIALVAALLKRVRGAYPVAVTIFFALFIYEFYRFAIHPSFALIILSAVDLIVISLILIEYRFMA